MTILQQRASDVRAQEINLSAVVTSASSAVGCQVVVSNQGSPEPRFFSNADAYLAEYGNPNAQISYAVYCGLDFFKEGNALWARRAVHSDALYSGAILYEHGGETHESHLNSAPVGTANPKFPVWASLLPNLMAQPIALFYPVRGPGSYAKIAVGIESANIESPTGLTATSANTGGVLPAATYQYQISALSALGETLASVPAVVVVSGAGSVHKITLTWAPVAKATGYVIYGRTDVAVGEIATVGQGVFTFTDTGAIVIDGSKLPIVSPADLPTASTEFTVHVYDLNVSSTTPLESFTCTLGQGTDSSGNSTELEERINPFSQYIQVTNNTPLLDTVPVISTMSAVPLVGGDSGTAPTAFDIAAAHAVFSNKQLYGVNLLINSGYADPIVQFAMDALAVKRWDSLALLDIPATYQGSAQQMINYRNLQLNLNSTYSGLFGPDVLEADNINGKTQYVPFSGWAAALCARTDRVANPSFSPAGLNRGLVNVLKSRHTYEDGEATLLFKAQVNYTRTFVGQGIALWEQKTLAAQDSALSWISVRRIINVIKTSLYSFSLYSVHEPNDDFTGRQIVGAYTQYLQAIVDASGLTSFAVISDSRNNTAAMVNSGIRVVTVIVVPLIPIHEIQLNMVISKQGINYEEVLKSLGV